MKRSGTKLDKALILGSYLLAVVMLMLFFMEVIYNGAYGYQMVATENGVSLITAFTYVAERSLSYLGFAGIFILGGRIIEKMERESIKDKAPETEERPAKKSAQKEKVKEKKKPQPKKVPEKKEKEDGIEQRFGDGTMENIFKKEEEQTNATGLLEQSVPEKPEPKVSPQQIEMSDEDRKMILDVASILRKK